MALRPIIRGDYEVVDFTVMEPDPDTGEDVPRDITNDTFTFTAKRDPKAATAVITKASGSGITKTDPVNGEGFIEILPEDTEAFSTEQPLTCDLQGIAPINKPYTTLFTLKIKLDITQ